LIFHSLSIDLPLPGRETYSYTTSSDAFDDYLKGRYEFNKRSPQGLKKSIQYFAEAIENDPSYVLAYGGAADSYNLLGQYEVLPFSEAIPKAKAAELRALSLDNTVGGGTHGLSHYERDHLGLG
jgi:hypothetical protein